MTVCREWDDVVPFFKANSKLIYFAHVPKCGGTSVERGIMAAGCSLSFRDGKWWDRGTLCWNKTSPQHISVHDLAALIDPQLFDFAFAIVRDPIDRFLSAFNHNREDGRIPFFMDLSGFLRSLEKSENYLLHRFDNHFVPASDIIPDNCKVFHLEDGLAPLAAWLRSVSGGELNVDFGVANQRVWNLVRRGNRIERFVKRKMQPKIPSSELLDRALKQRIADLYEVDYRRFWPMSSRNDAIGIRLADLQQSTSAACALDNRSFSLTSKQ